MPSHRCWARRSTSWTTSCARCGSFVRTVGVALQPVQPLRHELFEGHTRPFGHDCGRMRGPCRCTADGGFFQRRVRTSSSSRTKVEAAWSGGRPPRGGGASPLAVVETTRRPFGLKRLAPREAVLISRRAVGVLDRVPLPRPAHDPQVTDGAFRRRRVRTGSRPGWRRFLQRAVRHSPKASPRRPGQPPVAARLGEVEGRGGEIPRWLGPVAKSLRRKVLRTIRAL